MPQTISISPVEAGVGSCEVQVPAVHFRAAQPLAIDFPNGRVVVEPDEIAELPNGSVVLRRD